MQFDVIGLLFFLWFIFRGLQKSQQSKRAHEQRQRERQDQRPTVQRTQPAQPVKQAPRRARPEPKVEEGAPTSPFPPWFPFPIEIIEEVSEKKKPRVKPVEPAPAPAKAKASEVAPPRPIVEPVMATAISQGEEQWKSREIGLSLDKKSVVNGIIWAEVLGAPRSKRSNHRF